MRSASRACPLTRTCSRLREHVRVRVSLPNRLSLPGTCSRAPVLRRPAILYRAHWQRTSYRDSQLQQLPQIRSLPQNTPPRVTVVAPDAECPHFLIGMKACLCAVVASGSRLDFLAARSCPASLCLCTCRYPSRLSLPWAAGYVPLFSFPGAVDLGQLFPSLTRINFCPGSNCALSKAAAAQKASRG